jgi:hypothetical protein
MIRQLGEGPEVASKDGERESAESACAGTRLGCKLLGNGC